MRICKLIIYQLLIGEERIITDSRHCEYSEKWVDTLLEYSQKIRLYFFSFFLPPNFSIIDVTTESTRLKSNAHQKPSTLKPSNKLAAIRIIAALITNKNSPNVIKVTGMVKRMRMGLRKPLRIDSKKATQSAVTYSST